MRELPPRKLTGREGYIDAPDPEVNLDGLGRGSQNLIVFPGGRLRVARGPGSSAGRGDINAFLAGTSIAGATTLLGNVAAYRNTTYLIAGEAGATAYIEALAATFTIQSFTGLVVSGTQYPLAIPPPSAPTVDDDPTTAGAISGGVTFRLSFYRSTTKGESNASEASANVVFDSEVAHVTIPARPNASITHVRVYASKHGEGPLQINYYLQELEYGVDVNVAGEVIDIDYEDSDLNIFVQAPYVLNAAPDSQFIAVMGGHTVAVGCEPKGGFLIWPSIFQRLESFNANSVVVMNPPEPFTGVHGGGDVTDGVLLLGQRNAISAAILTGSSDVPVIPRNIFRGVGVASGNQLESLFGVIVALTGQAGLIRSGSGDDPETGWTEPVKLFMEGFDHTAAVVRYDPYTDMVVVAGNNSVFGGNCGIGYHWGRPGDIWSPPVALSFTPASGFVKDGRLYLTNGTNRYLWEGGSNTTGVAQYLPQDGGMPGYRKNVERFAVSTDAATADVVLTKDHAQTTVQTHAGVTVTGGWSDYVNTLVGRVRSFSAKVTITGALKSIFGIVLVGTVEESPN
jgi:hypothetical protein